MRRTIGVPSDLTSWTVLEEVLHAVRAGSLDLPGRFRDRDRQRNKALVDGKEIATSNPKTLDQRTITLEVGEGRAEFSDLELVHE